MSFWDGFSRGFDWGYNTTGRVLARRDIKALEDEEVKQVFGDEPVETVEEQQQGLVNKLQSNAPSSPVAKPTDSALLNQLAPDTPVSETGLRSEAGRFDPVGYEYAGETFEQTPNAFQKNYARQSRLADIYGRYGMLDRAERARSTALDAQGKGLDLEFRGREEGRSNKRLSLEQTRVDEMREQNRIANDMAEKQYNLQKRSAQETRRQNRHMRKIADARDAREKAKAESEQELFRNEQGVRDRLKKVNDSFNAVEQGDMSQFDDVVKHIAPLYNDPDFPDDNISLRAGDDGVYHLYDMDSGKNLGTAQAYFEQLSTAERRDILGLGRMYAQYEVEPTTARFEAMNDALYKREAGRAAMLKAQRAGGSGIDDLITRADGLRKQVADLDNQIKDPDTRLEDNEVEQLRLLRDSAYEQLNETNWKINKHYGIDRPVNNTIPARLRGDPDAPAATVDTGRGLSKGATRPPEKMITFFENNRGTVKRLLDERTYKAYQRSGEDMDALYHYAMQHGNFTDDEKTQLMRIRQANR